MIRKSLFSGSWYPAEKKGIEKYIAAGQERTEARACVSPHAGWMYSGKIAGDVFSRIKNYETYIIIGPNHTGYGPEASIYPEGSWQMPLGKVDIDREVVQNLTSVSEFLKPDTDAHSREHCIEVQIPFIQYFNPGAKIVPIILMTDTLELCKDITNAISETIKKLNKKNILLVASTDMTHYESQMYASKQDRMAIDRMLALDGEGLIKTVTGHGITMCGAFPTATVILAAKKLGAKKAELVKYATSGDVSGDKSSVVGYAGIILK